MSEECGCSEELLEGFTIDDEAPVLAFDPRRRTNAALIVDLVTLGFLHSDQHILDASYGPRGGFWTKWRPPLLVTNDSDDTTPAEFHFDIRHPPDPWSESFDVVVWDGPYGYRGTSRLESDSAYGVDGPYMPPDVRDALLRDGFYGAAECTKPGGLVLVKCQSQTVSGKKRHQPYMFNEWRHVYGLEFVMELHVFSHRKQPAGREQRLVHQNFSSALLYRRPK